MGDQTGFLLPAGINSRLSQIVKKITIKFFYEINTNPKPRFTSLITKKSEFMCRFLTGNCIYAQFSDCFFVRFGVKSHIFYYFFDRSSGVYIAPHLAESCANTGFIEKMIKFQPQS